MVSTRGRFLVLGGNPLRGSDALDSRMGACLWDLSLRGALVMGKLMGRHFLGGLLIFFLGGTGREEKESGHGQQGRSLDDVRFQTDPFLFYII